MNCAKASRHYERDGEYIPVATPVGGYGSVGNPPATAPGWRNRRRSYSGDTGSGFMGTLATFGTGWMVGNMLSGDGFFGGNSGYDIAGDTGDGGFDIQGDTGGDFQGDTG